MNDELKTLSKKIRFILEGKELPDSVKEKIEKVYQEYIAFYNENLKREIATASQGVASHNIERYIEDNYLEAMGRIQNKYRNKCSEKAEVITIVLSTLESQTSENQDEQIKSSEKDFLDNCVRNPKENYLYAENIIRIVVDSIENCKNQLFRTLDRLGTSEQKIEYVNRQIKLIENTAKLRLSSIKEDFDIDDEEISRQIFYEYEQYKQNQEKNTEQNSNAHQKFVSEYRVSEEDLQITPKVEEGNIQIKENEYEELPGNVIE